MAPIDRAALYELLSDSGLGPTWIASTMLGIDRLFAEGRESGR